MNARSSKLALVVRAWRSGSGSSFATTACSAMLRSRVTIGSQVACGTSHSAGHTHHRPNGAVILLTSLAGYWWAWFALWLLPRATWQMMITRFRNIAEHALVAKNEPDPLRHARSTHAGWLERILIAPYWVNYHCEHHMFMHVPCWQLPRVQRLLRDKGVLDGMLTAPGYWTVLKAAAGKPERSAEPEAALA